IKTNSVKYDKYKENVNTDKDDIIPMWISDMDFKTCDEITKALQTKLITGNLGYDTVNGYYEAVEGWMEKRHGLKITKEDIVYTPGVVTAINFLLKIQGFILLITKDIIMNHILGLIFGFIIPYIL
ncbi:hypothetical protein NE452_17465, partial [Paeniclostridium sordellii]|nr:hypothetical protein [Paeniclostridium sordellii]